MTKKEVIISIKGQQFLPDEDDFETVELVTSGVMIQDGQGYTLSYRESGLTGFDGTSTTLMVEGRRVTLMRSGGLTTQMVFEQGRKHLSFYDTDDGPFTVGVFTSMVNAELSADGGNIVMVYGVEIDHVVAGENRVDIHVSEAFNQTGSAVRDGSIATGFYSH